MFLAGKAARVRGCSAELCCLQPCCGGGLKKSRKLAGKKQPPKLEENHPQLHPRLSASESAQAKLVLSGEGGQLSSRRGFVWARCRCAPAERGVRGLPALQSGAAGLGWRSGCHRKPRTQNGAVRWGEGAIRDERGWGEERGDPERFAAPAPKGWEGLDFPFFFFFS